MTDCLPILPAGLDANPAVGVDSHGGAQHHRLGTQIVRHLDTSVHDGQSDVVWPLHPFPAPQHQALSGLCPDAKLKLVHQQSLFTGQTGKKRFKFLV